MSTGQAPLSTYIVGVRVDLLNQQETLSAVDRIIRNHRSHPETPCKQLVTVNPEFVMAAQKNHSFRETINQAEIVVADGVGIVLASRYLRTPTPERVTGTDLVQQMAKAYADKGYRFFLLGAAPGIAEEASKKLAEMAPGIQIAGTYAGSPAPEEEESILERIRDAQADLLFVAYGAPAQELWIHRNLHRLPVALAMGIGGAFDFLVGKQVRAPRSMQKMGLEWLYRLYREPKRWKRMLALPQFALQVLVKGHGRS